MTALITILALVQLLGMVWACRVTADAAYAGELSLLGRVVLILFWPVAWAMLTLGRVQ